MDACSVQCSTWSADEGYWKAFKVKLSSCSTLNYSEDVTSTFCDLVKAWMKTQVVYFSLLLFLSLEVFLFFKIDSSCCILRLTCLKMPDADFCFKAVWCKTSHLRIATCTSHRLKAQHWCVFSWRLPCTTASRYSVYDFTLGGRHVLCLCVRVLCCRVWSSESFFLPFVRGGSAANCNEEFCILYFSLSHTHMPW